MVLGAVVCRYHGGLAPQVKKKARERIRELVHPALDRLVKIIDNDDGNVSAQVAACRDILDRAGYKPTDKLELIEAQELGDPGREKLTDEQLDKLIALLESDGKPERD